MPWEVIKEKKVISQTESAVSLQLMKRLRLGRNYFISQVKGIIQKKFRENNENFLEDQ